MKKQDFLFIAVLFAAVSCNTEAPKSDVNEAVKEEVKEEKKALTVQLVSDKDPVCGMTVGTEPADTTLLNGKVYGFCSDDCKETFLKDSAAVAHH